MGRTKTYERQDVARKAMELFWAQGFNATSTKDLAEHMGINVYSLFAEFESKQGLYEAALTLYSEEVVTARFGELESPDAGLDEITAMFNLFETVVDLPAAARGCFMCNTATERAMSDPVSQSIVAAHFQRAEKVLCTALTNAQENGDLRADISCTDHGKLLTSNLVGLAVLMRAGVDTATIRGAVSALRKQIDFLRA